MHAARIDPTFHSWRTKARHHLSQATAPSELLWEDGTTGSDSLFSDQPENDVPSQPVKIPKDFFPLAELVACHRNPNRWGILYRVAYRLTHGGERHLLQLRTDDDTRHLEDWASAIRRDRHKMKAFVRFRKVGEADNREQFVAWFEPENNIVELTAPFFAKRFAGMDWSILTPYQCAHWDGDKLHFTPGVTSREAPGDDQLEDYWRSYYASIFNPARLKLKAMQSEMPVKYWRNLPEAPLIAELTASASTRAIRMVDAEDSSRAHVSKRIPKGVPDREPAPPATAPTEILDNAAILSLPEIATAASHCTACDLCERATQTVFGSGPENADIMIIGEQPGDQEDITGQPFTGPAGKLLDQALEEIGLERNAIYLTNTVKHFKWKRQGRLRLHQNPSASEVEKCKPWVLAEILKVCPKTIILLGSTAAKALIRPDFAITRDRGITPAPNLAERVIATFHPSYLLRSKNAQDYQRWIEDLRLATNTSD
ncbi:MAG: putative DNA metabolism protein [Verrucomicrobiales bacterium]|jgi:probable DNA metabolism protein